MFTATLITVLVLLASPFAVTATFRALARATERRILRRPGTPHAATRGATATTLALAALALAALGLATFGRVWLPEQIRGLAAFLGVGLLLAGWFTHSVPGHRRGRKYTSILLGSVLLSLFPYTVEKLPGGLRASPVELALVGVQALILVSATAYAVVVLRPDAPLEGRSAIAAHRWYRRLTVIQGADLGSLLVWGALSVTGLGSAYVILRYAAKAKLLQRPYLYLRSFEQQSGPRVFGEVIGPSLTRRGPFVGLVHATQPQSTLQSNVPLLWSSNFSVVGDARWQEWVLEVLGRAKGVILDVTGDTPGIRWEIEQALARVPPERLLVLRDRPGPPLGPGLTEVVYDLDRGLDEARVAVARWGSRVNLGLFAVSDPTPERPARRWRFFGAYDLAALVSAWLLLLSVPALVVVSALGPLQRSQVRLNALAAARLQAELQLSALRAPEADCDAALEQIRRDGGASAVGDAWGTPFRLECTNGPSEAVIHSAGPDRTFGTDDDLRFPER